jgi:hypothetical protein
MSEETTKPSLGPMPDFAAVSESFRSNMTAHGFNLLLLGLRGEGKTFNLRTAPKPVWIDCFDPGGGNSLRDVEGMEHGIFIDDQWSHDSIDTPQAFMKWRALMKTRLRVDRETGKNWFDNIGTYVIDSSTTWADSIMWHIMAAHGKPAGDPTLLDKKKAFKDGWGPHKEKIKWAIAQLVRQKCNFVLTGHLQAVKDKDGVIEKYEYKVTGNLSEYIPALFDEIWVTDPKNTPKGIESFVLTQNVGKKAARSRLALEGLLDKKEPLDIKAILKKAGFPYEDKPWK